MKLPRFNRSFKQVRASFRREVRFWLVEGWGVEEIAMAANVSVDEIRDLVAEMRRLGELGGDAGPWGSPASGNKGGKTTEGRDLNLTDEGDTVNDA